MAVITKDLPWIRIDEIQLLLYIIKDLFDSRFPKGKNFSFFKFLAKKL